MLSFVVNFSKNTESAAAPYKDRRLQDLSDYEISDLCERLTDLNAITFRVSGFGQKCWPVDTRIDLPVFLEQLTHAIKFLNDKQSFAINFYEQGIERSIEFEFIKSCTKIKCTSGTKWTPNPKEYYINTEIIKKQLIKIEEKIDFILSN